MKGVLTVQFLLAVICLCACNKNKSDIVINIDENITTVDDAEKYTNNLETSVTDFTFTVSEGVITITGYNGHNDIVIIPSAIDGLPVTYINEGAHIQGQKGIIIPDSITFIDIDGIPVPYDQSFTIIIGADVSLREYHIADSIGCGFVGFYNTNGKKSGTYLYNGNNWITTGKEAIEHTENGFTIDLEGTIIACNGSGKTLAIPSKISGITVKAIGNGVFKEMGLTKVDIPVGVASIGVHAFSENELASILIPDSVVSVGEYAFSGNQLTSISIGANVLLQVQQGYDPPSPPGPSFVEEFDNLYNANSKKSGTYLLTNGSWSAR